MEITPTRLKALILRKIESIVGPEFVSVRNLDRFNYSRDSNFKSTIRIGFNHPEPFPDVIVWPREVEQVRKLVAMARQQKIPIVPYGAGSGVSGGTLALQGGMVIDLKKMRKILRIDEENLLVQTEAGIMSLHLEEELERRGYTLGHFPSSILCASLGGCLAARSAGQKSTLYGKIEDMVKDLEVVAGNGQVVQTRDVSNTSGIDLNQIFLGSEGTLGLITKATLRIFPQPEKMLFRGIRFRDMKTGIEAVRRIAQSGLRPSVVRLYDEIDTLLLLSSKGGGGGGVLQNLPFLKTLKKRFHHEVKFRSLQAIMFSPRLFRGVSKHLPVGCVLILVHEGGQKITAEEQKVSLDICKKLGGHDLGEEPARHWYQQRYSISYNASPIFYSGHFTDTIEVATTWDKIIPLYEGMGSIISPHALVMAHLSHVYPDGASLYFTFVAPMDGIRKTEALYDLIWDSAMERCQEIGGVISHHHGIGRLKAKHMTAEWGEGHRLFRVFKEHFDPDGILNPGKLILQEHRKKAKAA